MNLLQQGSAWLESTRAAYATQQVTYAPAQGAPISVRATIGKSEFQVDDSSGLLTRLETRDYLILAADMVEDGSPIVPAPGDRISETAYPGAPPVTYEVMSPAGQPAWRWSDPYRQTYRIHARLIGSVN